MDPQTPARAAPRLSLDIDIPSGTNTAPSSADSRPVLNLCDTYAASTLPGLEVRDSEFDTEAISPLHLDEEYDRMATQEDSPPSAPTPGFTTQHATPTQCTSRSTPTQPARRRWCGDSLLQLPQLQREEAEQRARQEEEGLITRRQQNRRDQDRQAALNRSRDTQQRSAPPSTRTLGLANNRYRLLCEEELTLEDQLDAETENDTSLDAL